MPLKQVFVERGGVVVFCWVFGEFVGFPDCRLLAELEREEGVRGARIRLIVGDFVLNVWDILPFFQCLFLWLSARDCSASLCFVSVCQR